MIHQRLFIILFLLIFHVARISAQWESIRTLDSQAVVGNKITLTAGKAVVRISILASDMIRVHLAPTGVFLPDQSWAVVKSVWPEIQPIVVRTAEDLRITTQHITLIVKKKPLRLSFFDKEGFLLNQDDPVRGMSWDAQAVRVWKEMPQSENYYGFGEKAGSLNRKFKHMTMWNSDIPAYKADTDPLYQTIPFFYGINRGKAYGIFFDNSHWSSFDMGKEQPDKYSFGATGGELDYYFISGPSPKDILSRFTELVGRMPIPPRWSLGYQQCRWSYYPEARVRKLASDFRSKKIPCDMIYLDIDYMEGYRIFTWSEKNFPNPKKMIGDLAKDGFKIAVIVDPGIKTDSSYHAYQSGLSQNAFLRYPDGRLYVGKVWPGDCAFPDFSRSPTRAWWGDNFSALVDAGVRGFWNDMNEPSVFDVPTKTVDVNVIHDDNGLKTSHAKNHNLYGKQMTQATYEGVLKLMPSERPFVLTRASYAGGWRYSAAWTGDNIASWEHLEMAVPMLLNLSISGQPFVGSDIGGFVGSPNGELFARWLQLGVFSPLMRTHTVINSADQEPWSYGSRYEEINRKTIELRYRLLPYIYNAMVEAAHTGIPPMRPLAFEFPEDGEYAWNGTEFMFGDDLLIAPVLSPGATKREVRLPKGIWYEFATGKSLQGNKHVTVDAPVDRIPIFVRAGAIIPSQQVMQYSDQTPINPLTLTVYPAEESRTSYYEDDGHSFEYEKGSVLTREIVQTKRGESIFLVLSEPTGFYRPPDRDLNIIFVGIAKAPRSVEVTRKRIPQALSGTLSTSKLGWAFDESTKTVKVKMKDAWERIEVTVSK